MKRLILKISFLSLLAGCMATGEINQIEAPVDPKSKPAKSAPATRSASRSAMQAYAVTATRILPVAQSACRKRRGLKCNFRFGVDERASMPSNAFQTVDDADRPLIIFTSKLLDSVRNQDELAFIIAHEAAHHILGHLETRNESALLKGMSAKVGAVAGGKNEKAVEAAWKRGVRDGILVYSKQFEIEADVLGAIITENAGYDALTGALYFNRIPDPGNRIYATHPRNADRLRAVRAAVAKLRG
ncbi:MAG: M48 family metalloprotease [Brevirhabdus sp.]